MRTHWAKVEDADVYAYRLPKHGEHGRRVMFVYWCASHEAALKFAAEYRAGHHKCDSSKKCSDCQ